MKFKTKAKSTILGTFLASTLTQANYVLGADGGEVSKKINNALTIAQGILTGVIVSVGICVSLWIIIKGMPNMSNPHEKNEVYKSLGATWGLVAIGGAIVWFVPWIYSLFQ